MSTQKELEIDTSKLTVGMWIKDYPTLCKTIGQQTVNGGTQKKNQLQEFERFFTYEKSGRKFLITEIFNEPLPHDFRTASNSKYVQYIENILVSYFAEHPEEIIFISKTSLCKMLGMINDNYIKYRKNSAQLQEIDTALREYDINDFYFRCEDKFNKILKSAIQSLERRKLLMCEKAYQIGTLSADSTKYLEFREATDDELQYILRVQREQLHDMGFNLITEIFLYRKMDKYYKALNKRFREEKGWETVFEIYKFIYNQDHMIEMRNINITRDTSMKELNAVVLDTLQQAARNRYNNSKELQHQLINKSGQTIYDQLYLDNQLWLQDHLIKLKK